MPLCSAWASLAPADPLRAIHPACAMLAPNWAVVRTASSSSAIRTSYVLTRPSTDPDRRTCASEGEGWNESEVRSSECASV